MNDGDVKCTNCGRVWTIYKRNYVDMVINNCNEVYKTKKCKQ